MGGAIKHFLKKLQGHEKLGLWTPGLGNFFEKTVKPSISKAIVLNEKESEAKYKLTVDKNDIESTKFVKLLSITIDGRFRFDQNVSNLCSKAAMKLNASGRLQKYMGKPEKAAIVNSFIYANFNYCPLLGHLSPCVID